MKKIIKKAFFLGIIFLVNIISQMYFAQQQINYGDFSNPVPSVSAMANYQETPVSIATGLPSITIPLLNISSTDKNISESVGLSYNVNTITEGEFVSEVGLGWTKFSGGVISRTIISGLDERFDNAGTGNYIQNDFDDIYYYNLPNGISGKFKIDRVGNTFAIYDQGTNNVVIEYTRINNNATLIIDSFTIIDDKGYKYIFNDYSQNLYSESNKLYRSAFFLSKIQNASGVELLNYEYRKDNKYINNTNTLLYQSCKLKKINSPGLGNIKIEYNVDSSLEETFNDSYSISNVTLENNSGKVISKFSFEYLFNNFSNSPVSKRTLTKIKKDNLKNPNGNPLETTSFVYNTTSLPDIVPPISGVTGCSNIQDYYTVYPKERVIGVLKKIIMPTGGVTEYNFEPNEFFYNKNSPLYLASLKDFVDPYTQEIQPLSSSSYYTSQNNTFTFTVSGDPSKKKKIYFAFSAEPGRILPPIGGGGWETDPGDGSTPVTPSLDAHFKINNGAVAVVICGVSASAYEYTSQGYFEIYPGTYSVQIISPGTIKGNFHTSEVVTLPPPYKNIGYFSGLRIKEINTYESISDTSPVKAFSYKYLDFDGSGNSSGYEIQNESYNNDLGTSVYVVYKNIMVTDEIMGGYIKHYLKTPADYPETQYVVQGENFDLKHYYNITKGGLITKKEVFNSDNQKVQSTEYEYELQDQPGTASIKSSIGYVRPGIVRRMTVFDKIHNGSQTLTNKTEQEFNSLRGGFKLSKITSTSADGQISEKTLSYPIAHVISGVTNEYQHLWNSNMKGFVVNVTEKRNGDIISITDTKFANNSFYPTSIKVTNSSDNSVLSSVRYDNYDNRGNLVQFTTIIDEATGLGVPTTIIYGYNSTYPIAKIEGAQLSDIPSNLITAIVNASNEDANATPAQEEAKEQALITTLNMFKNDSALQSFMITCYTYNPLVGITTTILPNGLMELYKYDSFNRLLKVVDVNGNTVKEHLYNYKN